MLPRDYRFSVHNNTGVSIPTSELIVAARRYNFNSNGALVYEGAEAVVYSNVATIANNTFDVGTPGISNAGSLWVGGDFLFSGVLTVSGNGTLSLYLNRATDGGSMFDTTSHGTLVSVLGVVNSNTIRRSFDL